MKFNPSFKLILLSIISLSLYSLAHSQCTIYKCLDSKLRKNLTNTICRMETKFENKFSNTKNYEHIRNLHSTPALVQGPLKSAMKSKSYKSPFTIVDTDDDAESLFQEVQLEKCPINYKCNLEAEPDKKGRYPCIKYEEIKNKLPMEYCDNKEDCASEICKNNVCVGKATGEDCNENIECDIGLYCSIDLTSSQAGIGTCQKQKEIGKDCMEDEDCINTAGCLGSTCTKYFTLDLGAMVTDPRYCKTFYNYYDFDVMGYRCANSSFRIFEGNDCHVASVGLCFITAWIGETAADVKESYDFCHCTFDDKDDVTMCPYVTKQMEKHEGMKLIKNFYKNYAQLLHTSNRYDYSIMGKKKQEKIVRFLRYPYFQGAKQCVVDYMLGNNAQFVKVNWIVMMVLVVVGVLI